MPPVASFNGVAARASLPQSERRPGCRCKSSGALQEKHGLFMVTRKNKKSRECTAHAESPTEIARRDWAHRARRSLVPRHDGKDGRPRSPYSALNGEWVPGRSYCGQGEQNEGPSKDRIPGRVQTRKQEGPCYQRYGKASQYPSAVKSSGNEHHLNIPTSKSSLMQAPSTYRVAVVADLLGNHKHGHEEAAQEGVPDEQDTGRRYCTSKK